MRNLKRALSLAMASVMVLGLMVVGTGASYKDVTSEQNQEAIEVLQAAGVMVGDEKGNFNPDQNVTRNEMAVIMATGTYYTYSAIVDGEVTTLNVKADTNAMEKLFELDEKEIGVYFGITYNTKGFVTDVDENVPDPDDVEVIYTYEGTKAMTSAGILGFDYDGENYNYRPSGDNVAVVGYFDGDVLSVTDADGIKTDKNDDVILVIDDGSLVAVMITEVKG